VIDTTRAKDLELLVVTEEGFGKRTPIREYRVQGRGGSGVKTAKVTKKIGRIVTSMVVSRVLSDGARGDLIVISEKGQVIRLALKSVSVLGRATQGVRVMRFKQEGDKVASVTLV
jgi:DNA gyrase subunit A